MKFNTLYNRLIQEITDGDTPNPDNDLATHNRQQIKAYIDKNVAQADAEVGQSEFSKKNRRVLTEVYIYLYQVTNGFTDKSQLSSPEVVSKLKQFLGIEKNENAEHKLDFSYKRFMDEQMKSPIEQKKPIVSVYAKTTYIIHAYDHSQGKQSWNKIGGTNWKNYQPNIENLNIASLKDSKLYFRKMAEQYMPDSVDKVLPLTQDEIDRQQQSAARAEERRKEEEIKANKAKRLAMIKAAAEKIKNKGI